MEVSGKLADVENKSFGKNFQCCEHCQFENVTTEATGICRECEEYMCDGCFRHHLKGKRNRAHELIDGNVPEIVAKKCAREVAKCQQHDDEIIKFYCREHNAVGCADCIVLEHSACKPEYIKDLSKGMQETEEFKNLRRKLDQLDCDNKANHEKIDNNRRDCKKKHEELLKEIRKYRQDINTYLDQAEAVLISEAKKLVSETVNFLDQLENDWKDLVSNIESLKQKLDTKVHRDNELFIQVVRNKANVVKLEQEIVKYVQGFSKVKHYFFVPEMKCTTKLGNLKFSYPYKAECEEASVEMDRNYERAGALRQVAYGQPGYGQQQPGYVHPAYRQQQPEYGVPQGKAPYGAPIRQAPLGVPPGRNLHRSPPDQASFGFPPS